jgi:hypothetical protein
MRKFYWVRCIFSLQTTTRIEIHLLTLQVLKVSWSVPPRRVHVCRFCILSAACYACMVVCYREAVILFFLQPMLDVPIYGRTARSSSSDLSWVHVLFLHILCFSVKAVFLSKWFYTCFSPSDWGPGLPFLSPRSASWGCRKIGASDQVSTLYAPYKKSTCIFMCARNNVGVRPMELDSQPGPSSLSSILCVASPTHCCQCDTFPSRQGRDVTTANSCV